MKTQNILMATPLTAFVLPAGASVTLTAPKDEQHNVAYRVKNLLMAYG